MTFLHFIDRNVPLRYRGSRLDEISPGLRAIPSAGKGVIAFEIDETSRVVRILSMTWGGTNWMRTIAKRTESRP